MRAVRNEGKDYPTALILEDEREVAYFFNVLLMRQNHEKFREIADRLRMTPDYNGIDWDMWATFHGRYPV